MKDNINEPYDPFLNDEYDVISQYRSKIDMSVFGVNPTSYRPTPTEEDYRTGIIDRYFVRKNTSQSHPICEVSGEQYHALQVNPYYKTVSIRWKITGPVDSYISGETDGVIGVRDFNLREIVRGSEVIWQFPSSFKNLLEFYKKT